MTWNRSAKNGIHLSAIEPHPKDPGGRATETSALPQLYTVLELAVVFSLVVVAE